MQTIHAPRHPRALASLLSLALVAPLAAQQGNATPDAVAEPAPGAPAFLTNHGQWPDGLAARARVGSGTAWLHDRGVVLVLDQGDPNPAPDAGSIGGPARRSLGQAELRLRFAGGARAVTPVGVGELPLETRWARGAQGDGAAPVAVSFEAMRYDTVYPGIDALFRGAPGQVAYDFHLAPGASSTTIEIECEGLSRPLSLRADGALVMATEYGDVVQTAPRSFEVDAAGRSIPVPSRFELRAEDRYGFAVDRTDAACRLVIDPGIDWSTFLGGALGDDIVYVAQVAPGLFANAGFTESALPAPWNSTAFSGAWDSYVALIDTRAPGAAAARWSTMLGGINFDIVLDLAFDESTGLITIVGTTNSPDYPVTANAMQSTRRGLYEGVITQLDLTGNVVYSSYIGTSGDDRIVDVVAQNGILTVAGATNSPTFPMAGTPWQPNRVGGFDAVIARIDPTQSPANQLLASTFAGGAQNEGGSFDINSYFKNFDLKNIWVAANGEITIAMNTLSRMPTVGGYNANGSGGTDIWVARFDAQLSTLLYGTMIGGSSYDLPMAIVVDDQGVISVAGTTASPNFPTTASSFDPSYNGGNEAFVFRLDPRIAGTAQLVYSTYLGGPNVDEAYEMLLEPSSQIAVVVGQTRGLSVPTTPGAFQSTPGTNACSFLLRLAMDGNGAADAHYLSYLTHAASANTNAWSGVFDVAFDVDSRVMLVGETTESTFPVGAGGPQPGYGGGVADGFAMLMDLLPSGVTPIGTASPPCAPAARMQVNSQPAAGNANFGILCENGVPSGLGLLVIGQPLPGGTPALGIDLYSGPIVTLTVTGDAHGFGSVSLPVPAGVNVPVGLAAQFVWVQPTACGGTFLSASNALVL